MPELHDIRSTSIGPTNIGSLRVTRALAAMRLLDDDALAELRAAVCDYVCVQRALGATPEVLLAQIKQFVTRALPADGSFELRQAVTTSVVEWAIGAYYASGRDSDATTQRSSREAQG
jgi:hypothetical protein